MKIKLFTIIALLLFTGVSFAGEQLIAEWLINEGSGTTASCAPESYNSLDAELVGTQNWTTDENGTWFNFAGTQTFIAPYTTFPFDLSKSFRVTFDFWAGGQAGLIANDTTLGWGPGAWNIQKTNGYVVMTQHSSGTVYSGIYVGSCDKDDDGVIGDDWYSVEVRYEASTGHVGFNIDGVEDTGVTYYNGVNIPLVKNAARPNVGFGKYHTTAAPFIGGLRNVRIYQKLSKPTNPTPYNGQAAIVPGNITLDWDDSYGNYTAGYNVYLSTVEDDVINRSVAPVATSTSSADVTIDSDSVYYWAVDGDAGDPNDTVGDTWSFQTQGVKPYSLSPADAATNVSIFATLSWTEDSAVDGYKVYITDNQGELDTVTPIDTTNTEISLDADALELHRWYYWKVAAVIAGQEFDSLVSSFQTNGDEILDNFSQGSNAAVQADWVQQPGSGYDISWLFREHNPSFGSIPYGAAGTSSFIKTFDTPKDFTTAANLTIRVYHEADSLGSSATLTVTLLDSSDGVIYEDTYTPGDVLSDDDQFYIQTWYKWIMPLADVASMDQVVKVKLAVNYTASTKWLFIDDLTITVPQCDGEMLGDAYGDCQVDLRDFAVIAGNWLGCNRVPIDTCEDYVYEVFEDLE